MGRKKERIYHMKNQERNLCKALYRTGVMSEEDARKHFDVSDKRYDLMIKGSFIRRKGKYLYLEKQGQKYLENKLDMHYKYRTNEKHIKHDLKLNKMYLKLSEKQRETWKTETELRHELSSEKEYLKMYNHPQWGNPNNPHIRKNFIPDATVYSEALEQEVILEAITEYYSQTDIEQKEETAYHFYNGKIYIF